jgi:hypothetical protein
MTTNSDDQMPTTFPAKWLKVLKDLPEFKDSAEAASVEDLKKMIITAEGNISNIEKEKESDDKLNAAREIIKDLSAPYRDAIKCQMCKVKYALFLLDGKGEALGDIEK